MHQTLVSAPTAVSLRRLFPSASLVGCGDIAVQDVCDDSRATTPGSLFAALPGTRVHGRQFVEQAITRGAGALLVDSPVKNTRLPQCVVTDVRPAVAQLCEALYGYPSKRLGTVGVTGTNGKTTVTWLVRAILQQQRARTALLGTVVYHDGTVSVPSPLTTPTAKTLAQWLATSVQRGSKYAALEVSSHALDQSRVAGTLLDVAVVTNVTQDHFDYHGDYSTYREAKSRIFRQVKRGGLCVLNADDPGSASLKSCAIGAAELLTYGLEQPADVSATSLRLTPDGTRFWLTCGRQSIEMFTPLIGRHNVSNCLAAAAVAMHFGLSLEEIRDGLASQKTVPGRLEQVEGDQPFSVYVDYAHTDDALRRTIASLRELTSGRILCVFGAGGDRDRSKRPLLGRAGGTADVAIVTSDNPRSEDPTRIIEEVLAGCRATATEIHVEPDRSAAIHWAMSQAEPGDVVLVAGKGHETVQILGDAAHPFDDREVCRQALAAATQLPLVVY